MAPCGTTPAARPALSPAKDDLRLAVDTRRW
jgi:hypothetical protein